MRICLLPVLVFWPADKGWPLERYAQRYNPSFSLPVITGMADENPGADLYREFLYIVDSGANAAKMRETLARMATLGRKLIEHAPIGLPKEEGYSPRGLIRDQFVERTAAERLVDMLLAKVANKPFESEMAPTAFAPCRCRRRLRI